MIKAIETEQETWKKNPTKFPLRITADEWDKNFSGYDSGLDAISYCYDRFTLTSYLEWNGNIEAGGWGYQDIYEIVCPNGKAQKVTFGPHKTPGLAKKKALAYLVKYGAVEIIDRWAQ